MKKLFLFIILGSILACNTVTKNPKEPTAIPVVNGANPNDELVNDSTKWTTVQWLDSAQNFGKVTDGEKVKISFHFKNTGANPLVIANVQASCGCTVPTKPEEPIAPGKEGVITAEFNSSGRVGKATKNLTVTCNTKEKIVSLFFEGEVEAKQ